MKSNEVLEKICEVCSVPYITINTRQKYCSKDCANKILNTSSRKKYSVEIKRIRNNEWKQSDEGVKDVFEQIMTPTCQLCLSKDDVICKLREGIDDYRVFSPDSWSMLCSSCLTKLNSE